MSTSDLGRHVFQLGPFVIEGFDGGGFVESHLLWRYHGVPVVILISLELPDLWSWSSDDDSMS